MLLEDPDGAYSQLIQLQGVNKEPENPADAGNKSKVTEFNRQLSQRRFIVRSISRGSSIRSRSRQSLSSSFGLPTGLNVHECTEPDSVVQPSEEKSQSHKLPIHRLTYLNKPEVPVLFFGVVAATANGIILPVFGFLILSLVKTFYEPPHMQRKDSKFWAIMFMVLGMASLLANSATTYLFAVVGLS